MSAKHSRNERSASEPLSDDNFLSLNSPPAQPSTLLPDVDELTVPFSVTPESASNASPAPTLSTLLDFDQLTSGPTHALLRVVGLEDELASERRSPPFIQAPLPSIDDVMAKELREHSPQPLPIRPRIGTVDPLDASLSGHTRSPMLAREQTALESFSRTLRTYVPSTIPIPVPRSSPSPPRVSRPVSFGSFSASRGPLQPSSIDRVHQDRHGFEVQDRGRSFHGRASGRPVSDIMSRGSGIAQALLYRDRSPERTSPSPRGMSYPGSDATHVEPILWARWDKLNDKRFLILAYPSGFQLWDCTNLASVTEVLNVNTASHEWLGGGEIVHAAILPSPSPNVVQPSSDPYAGDRPLLGIVINLDNHRDTSTLLIYSLSRHFIIKRVALAGRAATFDSNSHSIVISLTNPPTLQIYSPTTFKEIYTINSNSLVPFAHSSVTYSNFASKLFTTGTTSKNNNEGNEAVFLGPGLDKIEDQQGTTGNVNPSPRPIFALSHRLLAYASLASSSGAQDAHRSPSWGPGHSSRTSPSSSPFGLGGLNMHMTQAELGNAAIKVGGSLLSGVKTLGNIALTAAKNHIMSGNNEPISPTANYHRHPHQTHRKYVSTSAPSGANLEPGHVRERRYSSTSMTSQDSTGRSYSGSEHAHPSPVLPNTPVRPEQGSYVTIIDLFPLLTGAGAPVIVAEWLTSRSQPLAGLHFSPDGCNIVVVPMTGQVLQLYQIRPIPGTLRQAIGSGEAVSGDHAKTSKEVVGRGGEAMVRMYHLHRGRSQAIVDDVAWAPDGRWVAIGTKRPTIHAFAMNPYGGKPDLRSHTKGKVMNVNELQPSSVEINPLVRLRAVRSATSDKIKASLAFTFVRSSESYLPSSLLPAPTAHAGGEPSSNRHHRNRPTNYQDLLVFDSNDGTLSLRRITTEVRAKDQGLSVAASMSMSALGATSVSFPGLGGTGKLSSSPSSIAYSTSATSNTSGKQSNTDLNSTHDLIGKDAIVATWNLQRRRDWEEIKQPILLGTTSANRSMRRTKSNYLANAELSTFSRSPRILPRPIYLSHQFSFYSLGEDYHALIRRSKLDITAQKIEVRKEVEVNAFPSSQASESFVEGFTLSRDPRRSSASFDVPLAKALAGGLDYTVAPPILPMYPNGAPGSRPRSFMNPIPIRTLGDGVSESLSRFRREINKVRSPHLLPRTENSSSPGLVALEFDEEDEDFLSREMPDGLEPKDDRQLDVVPNPEPAAHVLATSPNADHMLADDDASSGWDSQDRQAVEDEESFYDLVPPNLMDETGVKEAVHDPAISPSTDGKKKKVKSRRRW
ncbi:hypothetical protein AX15_007027 [Amanita polypyramis BW_CC]|nr:hypothetical protein AX15_007027 [Amanita polypyramis BW_CC]